MDRDQRIEHGLVTLLGVAALLDAGNRGAEELLEGGDVELRVLVADGRGLDEARAVEWAGGTADVVDEGLADRLEYGARLRRIVHFFDGVHRRLEAACHVDAVVAVGNLPVEVCQVILLGNDRGGHCVECVFDSCHVKNSFFCLMLHRYRVS